MTSGAASALWTVAAGLAAFFWARAAWVGVLTENRLDELPLSPPTAPPGGWPALTVVVAARDEARGVEVAIRSLLDQDYPDLSVLAVDDRSTDGTAEILDRLARQAARLRVLHIRELPEGWLGKNHACARGAEAAGGRWLLFTDGDVVFAPSALRRATAYAESRGLGHLVALPRLVAPGALERAFVATFAAFANLVFRTWELRRPGTSAFIGIGAFNLVRRDDYLRAGGHERLRLEAVDDVKLGMVLRRSGVRQGAIASGGMVSVRWNAGFLASWAGLLKNAFAGAEYRWSLALAAAAGLAFVSAAPLAASVLSRAPVARAIGIAGVALSSAVVGTVARRVGGASGAEGLLVPVTGPALAAALLASAAAATFRGAIVWRDTRYPLRVLRRGCVRARDWRSDAAVGWDPRWW